jgi:ribosomal protein S18 acetylase RimI-like enzyme
MRARPFDVRQAETADLDAVGRLLDAFNREFDEASPGAAWIAERLGELLAGGDTVVLVGGEGPEGVAVLRFRPGLWSRALECYLAELYVVPSRRGRGLGRALLEASMRLARERGADRIELGTSEDDVAARALYESMGFTNREGGADGPIMYVYEREL